jgi:transposase
MELKISPDSCTMRRDARFCVSAVDKRVIRLIHLPGFGVVSSLTVLAAIGDITRFPDAKHLVGYTSMGARVSDNGLTTRTGRITKSGRKDLRAAMVEAAQVVANSHPHWRAELQSLEPRLGHNKSIVGIARRLLVTEWFVWYKQETDHFAEPEIVARKLMQAAYRIGKRNRLQGQSSA